jgi:ribose transport system substrate-binding protein
MNMSRTLSILIGVTLVLLGALGGWYGAQLTSEDQSVQPPLPYTSPGEGSGRKRIILLTNSNSPFWYACRAGVREANRELGLEKAGLRAVMEVNDGTLQGQINKLRQFSRLADVAAIGISAIQADSAGVANEMRAFQERGIPVITVDSDVDREMWRDTRVAFLGTDNLTAGRTLGRCARTLRPEGGEYIAFVARTGAQNVIERLKGFAEGAGDRFKSDGNLSDDHDRAIARDNVRTALRKYPGAHTFLGIWSINGPAIGEVLQEPERKKDYTVVAMDADPLALDQMDKGLIDALVVQNPYQMGYQGVKLMKALVEKDQTTIKKMLPKFGARDGDLYDTGLKVVVPDQGSALTADLFDRQTEFLKLSDFRKWLDRYTLGGS